MITLTPQLVSLSRIGLIVCLVIVTALTVLPLQEFPPAENINDKVSHLLAFLALAMVADYSFPKSGFIIPKGLPLLAYGIGIEIVQSFIPYRSFSVLDMVADAAGLLVYMLLIPVLNRIIIR
ncbi:MAG: VanZ family protein [Gammaproteobacteria bacterium]|nr:VanZ family protein [Gammaproteobacteria bacterium]MDH5593970.1 VanZ family protein [Gammaproteobacteria bacterium]